MHSSFSKSQIHEHGPGEKTKPETTRKKLTTWTRRRETSLEDKPDSPVAARTSFGRFFSRRRRRQEAALGTPSGSADDGSIMILSECMLPDSSQESVLSSLPPALAHDDDDHMDALVAAAASSSLCGMFQPSIMTGDHQLLANHDKNNPTSDTGGSSGQHDQSRQRKLRTLFDKDDPTVQESIECVFRSRHERTASTSDVESTETLNLRTSGTDKPDMTARTSRLYRYHSHSRADVIQSQMDADTRSSPREQDGNGHSTLPQYPLVAPSSSFRSRQDDSQHLLALQKESQAWNLIDFCWRDASLHPKDSLEDLVEESSPPVFEKNHMAAGIDQMLQRPTLSSNQDGPPTYMSESSLTSNAQSLHSPKKRQSGATAVTGSTPDRSRPQKGTGLPSALHDVHSWPQYPLVLRPNTTTQIIGIRYSSSDSNQYIWTPKSEDTWPRLLQQDWMVQTDEPGQAGSHSYLEKQDYKSVLESGSAFDIPITLPINNGNEPLGKSLVIDFETDRFKGTLLLRIRHTKGTTAQPYDDNKGYFHGVNRRYQAVIRGRFKTPLPWTDLLTGFHLERPCGRLPPKFIVKSALKVISFFAPQLQAQINGPNPHCLTPLGSTPQSIMVHDTPDSSAENCPVETFNSCIGLIDDVMSEPTMDQNALLQEASSNPSSMHRARFRKKNFDRIYAAAKNSSASQGGSPSNCKKLLTDPSKVYTFEFLQHLFDFEHFSIELGSVLGSIPLAPILHGQPLQIMACDSEIRYLWGFELWHASLMEDFMKQSCG